MKRKSLSILSLLMAGIFMFASCTKDEDQDHGYPTIDFGSGDGITSASTEMAAGEEFKIKVIANWNENDKLTNLVVKQNEAAVKDEGINTTSVEEEITLTKSDAEQDIITIMVRDAAGNETSTTITITKNGENFGPIKTYEVVLMGAQSNPNVGSSLSLTNGEVYLLHEAAPISETIDLVYYYDAGEDLNTIASPGANIEDFFSGNNAPHNWETRNTTRFSEQKLENIDADAFNSMENDAMIIEHNIGEGGKRKAKKLSAGDYFAFRTENGKFGIFRVDEVSGEAEGTIKATFKVQE